LTEAKLQFFIDSDAKVKAQTNYSITGEKTTLLEEVFFIFDKNHKKKEILFQGISKLLYTDYSSLNQ